MRMQERLQKQINYYWKRISNIQFKEDRLMNINANYGQSQGGRF